MFSTINSVKEYTNVDVDLGLIKRAQAIVEMFIGKDEIDIENPMDLLLLDKITAYQSAYMIDNEEMIYKQIGVTSTGSGGSVQTFNTTMSAPYIAPLAVIASSGLSFRKSKSLRTGRIFQKTNESDWKKY